MTNTATQPTTMNQLPGRRDDSAGKGDGARAGTVRIERSATSISWIPSDSIPGLQRLPFEHGLMHYDPPPSLVMSDLEAMRARGEFRFANRLRAWVDVHEGEIVDCGYVGGTVMGRTPFSLGPIRVTMPAKGSQAIQRAPDVRDGEVTFVQSAGGRPAFSFLKPSTRWPFLVTRPFMIWTTIRLTIRADGTATQELIGASPFPRHWLYDDHGQLVEKAALTQNKLWVKTAFGSHSPWGGEDSSPVLAGPETPLERTLSQQIMQGSEHPVVRSLRAGELLFQQHDQGTAVAVILDGNFEIRVDGAALGTVGPGAVVGERALFTGGHRSADVRALTEARVGQIRPGALSQPLLHELARSHGLAAAII